MLVPNGWFGVENPHSPLKFPALRSPCCRGKVLSFLMAQPLKVADWGGGYGFGHGFSIVQNQISYFLDLL